MSIQIAQIIGLILFFDVLHNAIVVFLAKCLMFCFYTQHMRHLYLILFGMAHIAHSAAAARTATGAAALPFLFVSYHTDYYRRYNTRQYQANKCGNYNILNKHFLFLSMNLQYFYKKINCGL